MTSYYGTDFNDLAKLLFGCIAKLNPNFDLVTYLNEFGQLSTNVDRVNFVYKDIKKYPNVFAKFTGDIKDDSVAAKHADSAKIKFNSGNYWGALEDYARSAANAKTKLVLGLAYGNRSECFMNLNLPDKCIEEIDRALKNDYPKDLLESLIERRKLAEEMQTFSEKYYEPLKIEENFFNNPKIQCASDCVTIESNEEFGKHIVASRDIQIGEIISLEKPFACVPTTDRHTHCHHCLTLCYNLLPCDKCTVALFCSETCKNNAHMYHKYECPILLTICYRVLCEFAADESMLLALKVALLTKDYNFGSKFSKAVVSYCSDHYKEIHCLEIKATYSTIDIFHQTILTCIIFELLWNYTSFFSGIFSTSDVEDKFKDIMLHQLQSGLINYVKIYEYVQKFDFTGTNNFGLGAYAFFPLFRHSCCANIMKTYHGTTMVLRALNTIRKGEECFVNRYGLRYDAAPKATRQQFFVTNKLDKCKCKACKENWDPNLRDADDEQICRDLNIDVMDLGVIVRNIIGTDVSEADKFLENLIPLLKQCEDSEPTSNALALKNLIVHCFVVYGNKKLEWDLKKDVVLVA